MTKKRVRIKDIAIASGVSTGTVDRVIHNRGNVTPEVKKRVEDIMKQMNYRPNIIARTLANNKTLTIAALIPDFKSDIFWEFPKIGMEKAMLNNGHFPVDIVHYFFDEKDVKTFEEQSQKVLEDRPDALIIAPIFAKEAHSFLQDFSKTKIPFVLINTNLESEHKLCYVGQDSFQSGVLGARLLSNRQSENATFLLLHLEEEENAENATHIIQKEEGFLSYFKDKSKKYTIIKQALSDEKRGTSLADFLYKVIEAYPQPAGIFLSTSKAYQLVEILGNKLQQTTIVGYDLLPQNVTFLKEGKIDYLINQNPEKQGNLALISILDHLFLKKEVNATQYLPLNIVVKENVKFFIE